MKALVLAACLVITGSFSSIQAAGADLVIDDNESGSAAEATSSIVSTDRSADTSDQRFGILLGKPLFRLDPKYGDVCVQTVFGKVNGAQVRVTW